MTREELLESICPTAETYACNIDNMGSCTYCNELMNRFLDEYDKQIRAEVIEELKGKKDEIIRWLIKRDKEGYGTTDVELLDHILDIAEQLKEQK